MSKLIRIIGSIVFSAFMYCVPIIFTCSFFLGWDSFIKWILCICTIGQFLMLCAFIYFKSDEE